MPSGKRIRTNCCLAHLNQRPSNGMHTPSKGRQLDPKVFEMDLSHFRFSNKSGWHTLSERTHNQISCVSYYFGIELYKELDIPIGLIMQYNSGTPI